MYYILAAMLGAVMGGAVGFVLLERPRRRLANDRKVVNEERARLNTTEQAIERRRRESEQAFEARNRGLENLSSKLQEEVAAFERRPIAFEELRAENDVLKRDLRNVDMTIRRLELERRMDRESQAEISRKSEDIASRYLKDNAKWLSSSLTTNNFVNCKDKLNKVIEACRGIGFAVSDAEASALVADLKIEYERLVRAQFAREEQARIRAQIREEQLRQQEIERELQRLERERAAIGAALERALSEAHGAHSAEVDALRARLAEAEAKSQRAVSQAQLTKAGYVYVISNVGTFGEGVFKVGMTRRLEPNDRIRELGDASVPFGFDIHMLISCDDAPALEYALHRELNRSRVNRINPRKEFFRTDLDVIIRIVEQNHGKVDFIADAAALEYRQSLAATDEDQEFVRQIFDGLDDAPVPEPLKP